MANPDDPEERERLRREIEELRREFREELQFLDLGLDEAQTDDLDGKAGEG